MYDDDYYFVYYVLCLTYDYDGKLLARLLLTSLGVYINVSRLDPRQRCGPIAAANLDVGPLLDLRHCLQQSYLAYLCKFLSRSLKSLADR